MQEIVWAWMPGLILVMSLVALATSVIAIHITYRLDRSQVCAMLSAGLSIGYVILAVDFATAIHDSPSPSMRHYAWTAAAVGTLTLIIVSNAPYWSRFEPLARFFRLKGRPS